MEKDGYVGETNIGFVNYKWGKSYMSESLCYAFKYQFICTTSMNRKVAPRCRYASENRGCYIDGSWTVHYLRHRKGEPICVAIVWDTLLDVGFGGSLKETDDAISADNNMKRPTGVDLPGLDINDVKNRFSFS